jgi:predicted ABC-type exoprotein transport system permease subunit
MKQMTGYHWAVTGAAAAFSAVVFLKSGTDVWATHSGLTFLTELAGAMLVSVLFGAYGWVILFLIVWPLFLLTTSLANALETRSLVYFITCGALTGALLSALLLALPRETSDQHSVVGIAMWVTPSCVLYGVSGAWLFWWKAIGHKPAA